MEKSPASGSREIEHQADWALQVWAPDLAMLFQESASGMMGLLGIELDEHSLPAKCFVVKGNDPESVLVSFLDEILFLIESERFGPDRIDVQVEDLTVRVELSGRRILNQRKEIKAITFHKLAIQKTSSGLTTTIVFDV